MVLLRHLVQPQLAGGMFPENAQEEYWAESPDTLSSTSFNPAGGLVDAAEGDTGLRDGGTFPAGAIRKRGSCSYATHRRGQCC